MNCKYSEVQPENNLHFRCLCGIMYINKKIAQKQLCCGTERRTAEEDYVS